jgi:hypothetical protein
MTGDSDMHQMSFSRERRCVLMLTILGLSGCTVTINPPKEAYTGYVPLEKIRLRVGLRLTEELRKYKWEQTGWEIPIGEALARDLPILTRQVFTDVVDVQGNAQIGAQGLDAILTPRVAYVNRTSGATSFGDSIFTVKVEWNMDGRNNRTIWVDTVTGEATGMTGWSSREGLLKRAYEEFLLKSQDAMSRSPAIRRYALSP